MRLLFVSIVVLIVFHTDFAFGGCANCASCNVSVCDICDTGYYLSDDSCLSCQDNCQTCINQNNCTECLPNKWGAGSELCIHNCNEECLNGECHDRTGYCLQCKHGKYGRKCQNNCSLCMNKNCDLYHCVEGCKEGFYAYKTFDNYFCEKCGTYCKRCENKQVCNECNDGYRLYKYHYSNTTYAACNACESKSDCLNSCFIQGCDQCQISSNNNLICTDCPNGQEHNGIECINNTNMTDCDINGNCSKNCLDGLTGENCTEQCYEKCFSCSKIEKNVCVQCKSDFYTANCNKACGQSCKKVKGQITCRLADGYCLNGCDRNTWDKTCNQSCSDGCLDQICDRDNGSCIEGCKNGYTGDRCKINSTLDTTETITESTETSSSQTFTEGPQKSQKRENERNNIIIIASATGGGLLVMVLIIVLGVCLLKRRHTTPRCESAVCDMVVAEEPEQNLYAKPVKKPAVIQVCQDYIYAQPKKPNKLKEQNTQELNKRKPLYDNVAMDLDDNTKNSHKANQTNSFDRDVESQIEEETYVDETELEELDEGNLKLLETVNPPSSDLYYNTASLIRSRIQISDLLEYIRKKSDYEDEFEKLPKGLTRTCDEALIRNNRRKNRYNGVYAYDATRVILKSKTYINANYIDGHKESPEYIASLGPTKTAMDGFKDFLEMIWQEETKTIIMLTNLDESGKMKCEQYWPDQGKTKNYRGYKVTCTSEQTYSEFTIRELSLTMPGHGSRKITQYHYTAWPDRSVPDNVASLIEFRNKVEQTKSQDAGPMVVHCSAGIGRTGTYIALDILMQEGMDENYVDIFGRVMALRGQRGHMVQNLEQYIFLHRCLLYALTCYADPLSVKDIPLIMTEDKVSKQYKIFMKIDKPNISERKSSANKKIRKENRNGADIPNDEYRVRLTHSKHDYINAVYVNGYKTQYKFIVAQTPLQNTVEDFISMVYQEKCACIIDLDDENLNDTSVGQYLPQDRKATKVGHFQVACKNVKTMEHILTRDLTISRTGLHLSGELHLKHYQFKGWNMADKVPNSVEPLFELVNDVENEIKDQRESRPIVIHCLNGADRSCLFCAVSIILEKCNIETKISILNTICQLHSRRKSAFTDIAHYRFCYKCVNHLSKNSDKRRYYNMTQLL